MSLEDVLKGYEPEENVDSQIFEILQGRYMTAITKLALEVHDEYGERYQLELTVNEVLKGNGTPGRKFWKTYKKDDDGLKRLMRDLFTAGIDYKRGSVDDFESTFGVLLDAPVLVSARGWKPDKKMDGTPIPEEQQAVKQVAVIVSQKTKAATAKTPF